MFLKLCLTYDNVYLLLMPPRSRMILQSFTVPYTEKNCFSSISVVYTCIHKNNDYEQIRCGKINNTIYYVYMLAMTGLAMKTKWQNRYFINSTVRSSTSWHSAVVQDWIQSLSLPNMCSKHTNWGARDRIYQQCHKMTQRNKEKNHAINKKY